MWLLWLWVVHSGTVRNPVALGEAEGASIWLGVQPTWEQSLPTACRAYLLHSKSPYPHKLIAGLGNQTYPEREMKPFSNAHKLRALGEINQFILEPQFVKLENGVNVRKYFQQTCLTGA